MGKNKTCFVGHYILHFFKMKSFNVKLISIIPLKWIQITLEVIKHAGLLLFDIVKKMVNILLELLYVWCFIVRFSFCGIVS